MKRKYQIMLAIAAATSFSTQAAQAASIQSPLIDREVQSVIASELTLGSNTLIAQSLPCNQLEVFFNAFRPQILEQINTEVSGASHRISRRKRLIIHRVDSIRLEGCRMTAVVNVTLKRKVRRDAHGTVTVRANISANPAARQVCYRNPHVADVSLSRTLGIGERFYAWVANKVLPAGDCINL